LLPNLREEKGDIADDVHVPVPVRERFPESLLDFGGHVPYPVREIASITTGIDHYDRMAGPSFN